MRTKSRWTNEEVMAALGKQGLEQLRKHYEPKAPALPYDLQELNAAHLLHQAKSRDYKKWAGATAVVIDFIYADGRTYARLGKHILAGMDVLAGSTPVRAKQTRRKVTDPEVLEKRKRALEKARAVRAEQKAAAKAREVVDGLLQAAVAE